jgi:hypothetical protein
MCLSGIQSGIDMTIQSDEHLEIAMEAVEI